jgi:hypothetical protein
MLPHDNKNQALAMPCRMIRSAMIVLVALTLSSFTAGCSSKAPDPDRQAGDTAPIASMASASKDVLPDLQPIPRGHMCRGADLYRKAPMAPGGWEKVTDGSAAKYCRLEEVCKLGPCADRLSPADR